MAEGQRGQMYVAAVTGSQAIYQVPFRSVKDNIVSAGPRREESEAFIQSYQQPSLNSLQCKETVQNTSKL